MKVLCILSALSIALCLVFAAEDDPKPNKPAVKLDKYRLEWSLPDLHASRAWSFLEREPICVKYGGGNLNRRNPPVLDVEGITAGGIAFLQQAGNDGSLAEIWYQTAEQVAAAVIPMDHIPVFVIEESNQAMANLIGWMSTHMLVDIYYAVPAYIPTAAYFTIASLVIGCFQNSRSERALRQFTSTNRPDSTWTYKNYCKDVPKEYIPMCDSELCLGGRDEKCTTEFMKDCACWIPNACPPPDLKPFCSGCGGHDPVTGLCQGEEGPTREIGIYRGCECEPDPENQWHIPYPETSEFESVAKAAKDTLGGGGGNNDDDAAFKCNGLDNDRWAFEPEFADGIHKACADPANLRSTQDTTKVIDISDRVSLSIDFPDKKNGDFSDWDISTDTCVAGLFRPVSGCDGNDRAHNPGNLKHGGRWKDEHGLTWTAEARQFNEWKLMCNGWADGKIKGFVKADKMRAHYEKDVCTDIQLWANGGLDGDKTYTYEEDNDDAVSYRIVWGVGVKISTEDCIKQIAELHDGCDVDPVNNQFNFKFGGLKAKRGISYAITPLKTRMPISSGSGTGNAGNGRSRGDTGRDGKKIDKAVLQMCLAGYGDLEWDGLECAGMVYFYKGHYSSWNSARDCHNGCVNSLSKLIDDGVNKAYCSNCANGVAVCCHEGYEF